MVCPGEVEVVICSITYGCEKIFFPKEHSLNLIFRWLLRKHIAFIISSFSSVSRERVKIELL